MSPIGTFRKCHLQWAMSASWVIAGVERTPQWMVAPSAFTRNAPLRRSRTTLRLIHAPHAAPYAIGLGLRPARRGRGSRAVVVRFMPVQGRPDNRVTLASVSPLNRSPRAARRRLGHGARIIAI